MHGYPDFEGDKSGLYLKPEWASKEGIAKTSYGLTIGVASGDYGLLQYTVPAGKAFYITQASCATKAVDVADRDNITNVKMDIVVASNVYWTQGGQSGLGIALPQPIKAVAGELISFFAWNYANHDVNIWQALAGYEVDA